SSDLSIEGKRIFLIEDLMSTAGSIIENAQIIKKSGAAEVFCVPIFSYGMRRSKDEFNASGFDHTPLLTISDFLPSLEESLSESEYKSLVDWIRDPEGWFGRHSNDFDFGFLTQLRRTARNSGSIICFGLDPLIKALPEEYADKGINGFVSFMELVFSSMPGLVSPAMFKPNLAWWQDFDNPFDEKRFTGSEALVDMMKIIKRYFPNVPINIDFKKGDIGTSSSKWASYGFEKWRADAVTAHSYMGRDSVGPFTDYCNNEKAKGAYLLVKTTNEGAVDLELKKMADGRFVYEEVADNVIRWAKGKPGVGAVTAGNSPEELMVLGKKFAGKDIPLLIPGVGESQGGDAGEVADILRKSGYELGLARINLSSGLTHPWYKPGKPNPSTKECVSIIINTLRSLNEKVGYSG
ncbi:MAG: Orotate phosphoribosyltransferase, partial [Patescibacteria group bacterium]|nr:Orotate phosphoribosyltransferase [Patescibacteria group bacterium]